MKNTKKKLKGQSRVVKYSFSGNNITKYSGFNTVAKYMNKQGIVKSISTLFPTEWHSATKFGVNQILISIAMSSFCGINRICKIASFTGDGLVRTLLKLDKAINENAISATLRSLGKAGHASCKCCCWQKMPDGCTKAGSWKEARILKDIRTVKEYVETYFFGESKIVPVYQYACYIRTYKLDAAGLHKIYKQRSTSETWIEQVKSHVMAGATLTGDFCANDILWQLSILAYNIYVMMR